MTEAHAAKSRSAQAQPVRLRMWLIFFVGRISIVSPVLGQCSGARGLCSVG